MTTTPIKRSVAITAIAASTLGGVATGAAFFTPVIAGAQDDAVESRFSARAKQIATTSVHHTTPALHGVFYYHSKDG